MIDVLEKMAEIHIYSQLTKISKLMNYLSFVNFLYLLHIPYCLQMDRIIYKTEYVQQDSRTKDLFLFLRKLLDRFEHSIDSVERVMRFRRIPFS